MPPRAAAYLEIAAMRERVFMAMLERTNDVQKAIDNAYSAMCFIEDGNANMASGEQERTRTSKPGEEPVDEPWAPGNAEKAPAGNAESADHAPGSASEVHHEATAGVGAQSGAPTAEAADYIKIGHTAYSPDQIDRFKSLWANPNSTGDQISKCLDVTFMTAVKVARRLGLGERGKKRAHHVAEASTGAGKADIISLDTAIDWYEAQGDGHPVLPSEKYPGNYELEGKGAALTRNALVAEINAMRLRKGLVAFTINLNGV